VARDLSTKGLSRRLHVEYAGKRPFRQKLLYASLFAVVVLGALWAAFAATRKPDELYQPGPVATVHKVVSQDCTKCHDTWKSTPDSKCQECHASPDHNQSAVATLKHTVPGCAQCHLDHRGGVKTPTVQDKQCLRCHRNLGGAGNAKTSFQNSIAGFTIDHPEFADLKQDRMDNSKVKFNHKFHLVADVRKQKIGTAGDRWPKLMHAFLEKLGLQGKDLARTELACTDCHTPDSAGKLMQPLNYEKHCASCHKMEFELETRSGMASVQDTVPHKEPVEIHRYLLGRFTEQKEKRPEFQNPTNPAIVRQANEWVGMRVKDVENILISSGKCEQCHVVKAGQDNMDFASRLQVEPTGIPSYWFNHAKFDHLAHRAMMCESCHATARNSDKTEHINLPKIKDCQSCHSASGGARSDCAECHFYHDKQERLRTQGMIRELPGSGSGQ
jgi:hypothetical protein